MIYQTRDGRRAQPMGEGKWCITMHTGPKSIVGYRQENGLVFGSDGKDPLDIIPVTPNRSEQECLNKINRALNLPPLLDGAPFDDADQSIILAIREFKG